MTFSVTNNAAKIWQQMPDETPRMYEYFRAYLDLGKERTILNAYRLVSGRRDAKAPTGWVGELSGRYEWRKRVRAWEDFNAALEIEAEEQALRERRAVWAGRKADAAAKTWNRGQILEDIANELRNLPRVKKIVKKWVDAFDRDGKPIQIETEIHFHPIRFSMKDIVTFFREADRMQRLATGENTEIVNITNSQTMREDQVAKAKQALIDARVIFPDMDQELLARRCAVQFDLDLELLFKDGELI